MSQSLSRFSGTSSFSLGEMSLGELSNGQLCCGVFRALSLNPVPVIEDMVYIPGAEGFPLAEMMSVTPCQKHKFNFAHSISVLMRQHASALFKIRCPCTQSTRKQVDKENLDHVGRGRAPRCKGVLWGLEINQVVTAYRWILNSRNTQYAKCCEAVVVFQIKQSRWLPPGLYVYRQKPKHFGCTLERPITVIEQFNFNMPRAASELPNAITIDIFPGYNNFSAMYIVMRKHSSRLVPEYSNRIFGEAAAMGIMDLTNHPPENITASERYEVAIRTERMYVLDMRWRAFDTLTACVQAIPEIKGLKAIFWSNHTGNNVQEIECAVLSWIFGHCNDLPREVRMVDYTAKTLEVGYILINMDTYPSELPEPPRRDMSFFVHTYFEGDQEAALIAAGVTSGPFMRMCSPCVDKVFASWYVLPPLGCCQPTPYTCGDLYAQVDCTDKVKGDVLEWTLSTGGVERKGLAVQHTLYYHCEQNQFKMMVCHTVYDTDTDNLNVFRL